MVLEHIRGGETGGFAPARLNDLEILAERFALPLISVEDLIEYRKQQEKKI